MLKYYNYDIVFQEIPDEVTLAINLTCCPNRCDGCHSPHLWEDIGAELTSDEIDAILRSYLGRITCVCLMGGDNDKNAVEAMATYIKSKYELRFAWYSGREKFPSNIEDFDYVKLGRYDKEKGGLKSADTNQRIYKVNDDFSLNVNGNLVYYTNNGLSIRGVSIYDIIEPNKQYFFENNSHGGGSFD